MTHGHVGEVHCVGVKLHKHIHRHIIYYCNCNCMFIIRTFDMHYMVIATFLLLRDISLCIELSLCFFSSLSDFFLFCFLLSQKCLF